jgi:hypothetical protein
MDWTQERLLPLTHCPFENSRMLFSGERFGVAEVVGTI